MKPYSLHKRLGGPFGRCCLRAVAACTLCLFTASASAYMLVFQPFAQTVGLGGQATVAVRVVDTKPAGLGAYDLDVTYDPAILAFDHAVDGLGLGLAFGLGTSTGVASVTVSDFSLETIADLLALQANSFDLFTLVFDTVGLGTSALGMQAVTLGDATGNLVAFTAGAGSVAVVASAAVPEPGTLALVASALLACIGACGCRRRTNLP